jgi:NAD(P)H-dependent FMN reductase
MNICIISGTNRANSRTLQVAIQYKKILEEGTQSVSFLSLENVNVLQPNPELAHIALTLLEPATHFIFVSPEYNGSIPGVLKCLIDWVDVKKCWAGKKALLVGVAAGRAGNLRGMDHLSGILNHVKILVHYNKLPLSNINNEINELGEFAHSNTLETVKQQINDFIVF